MAYANVHINRFKQIEILSIFLLLLFIAGAIHKKDGKSAHLPLSSSRVKEENIPDSIQCANRTVLPQQAVWIRLFGKIRTECSCRESPTTKKVCCKEFATHLVLIRHSATFHASADTSGIFFRDRLSSRATVSADSSCRFLLRAPPTGLFYRLLLKILLLISPPLIITPPGVWRKEGDSNP